VARALITGGAGFIGSHLADELLAQGYQVRVLDALEDQVHGEGAVRPDYLAPEVELLHGSVLDPRKIREALSGVDYVYHFAARVGVGQSMYRIADYTASNGLGTAHLLEALLDHPVRRLVVASSMSVYGEGLYRNELGEPVEDARRSVADLKERRWEPMDGEGRALTVAPTPEWKRPDLTSVYALSKFDQERLCLIFGRAYEVPVVALRFFNVYGTRQALSNPYTGVLAIFASRLLNGQSPVVFEDGLQRRDFVHVKDIARACLLALTRPDAPDEVFNIGSGQPLTVLQVAEELGKVLGKSIPPQVTGQYRAGDIRHCVADIAKARTRLGYAPTVSLPEGLQELAGWLVEQSAVDRTAAANQELAVRGLTL
jgi:dTDP-L-rhamnose 4-epimerase